MLKIHQDSVKLSALILLALLFVLLLASCTNGVPEVENRNAVSGNNNVEPTGTPGASEMEGEPVSDTATETPNSTEIAPTADTDTESPLETEDSGLEAEDVDQGVENEDSTTGRLTVRGIEPLGLVTFDTGFQFDQTEVGGLSAITYDASAGVYYVLSDDRSQTDPARFYTVRIDLEDGSLDPTDVNFLTVTFIKDETGELFDPGSLDPEGIHLGNDGRLYISSEGDAEANPPVDPFVNAFDLTGQQLFTLDLPVKFRPSGQGSFGVRPNEALESLSAFGNYLFTATESALVQDGPPTSLDQQSPARMLEYNLEDGVPGREYVYPVSPIPFPARPAGGSADNGLVELQAVDGLGNFLALERSYAVGVGNTVRLFWISTEGATEVSAFDVLPETYSPVTKHLVADFEQDLGIDPDNLEGMTFGPLLPDGRITLIVVSDNNFNPQQVTQFIVLALELGTEGE